MKVVRDNLWLCVDCLFAAVNGDFSGMDGAHGDKAPARIKEVEEGLVRLGPHLVPDFDSETDKGIREFSSCGCSCCNSRLAGTMHRFAILGA